jgi:hypothetical protein
VKELFGDADPAAAVDDGVSPFAADAAVAITISELH